MPENNTNSNTPKKILFLITKSNFGGAQRYIFDLAKELKSKNYSVKVAMGGSGILFDKLKDLGIETIKIPGLERDINLYNEIRSLFNIFLVLNKERPDILHLNSSKSGLGALVGRICMVPKIIFTLHGLAINEERSVVSKVIIKILYWITIILSHNTIAVSNSLKKQISGKNTFISRKITVIHNGIDTQHFLTRQDARKLLKESIKGIGTDLQIASLFIGTVGELHPIKGHYYLIDGFKEALSESSLPLYLFIIGDGQDKKNINEYITKLSLSKNIFMCGHIDNAVSILKAFDIFVLPSISEGLPYAILESGAANLPTICSGVGGIPEIVQDGENGLLIKPKSPEEITDAILSLIFDHNIRKSLGTSLHEKINNDFTISKMIKETEVVYMS